MPTTRTETSIGITVGDRSVAVTAIFTATYSTAVGNTPGELEERQLVLLPCDLVNDQQLHDALSSAVTTWAAQQVLDALNAAGTGIDAGILEVTANFHATQLFDEAVAGCKQALDLGPDSTVTATIDASGQGTTVVTGGNGSVQGVVLTPTEIQLGHIISLPDNKAAHSPIPTAQPLQLPTEQRVSRPIPTVPRKSPILPIAAGSESPSSTMTTARLQFSSTAARRSHCRAGARPPLGQPASRWRPRPEMVRIPWGFDPPATGSLGNPQEPFAAQHPSPPNPRDPLVLDLAGAGIQLTALAGSPAARDRVLWVQW